MTVTYFGSHVDVPYTPALNPNGPFTVELWANPNQITGDFFCPAAALDANENGGNSRDGWILYESSGSMWQFRVGGANGYTATLQGGTVHTNTWQHLVGVYDGANATFYVNGVQVAGPSSAAGFAANATMPLRIGATTIPNRTFDGRVDEVAFYTNALSASVVAAHYNVGISGNGGYGPLVLASHPVGYWHLDDPAFTMPATATLPLAINLGALAPNANGIYEPGALPGALGVPNAGFGVSNLACLFNGAGYIDIPAGSLNLTGPLSLVAWTRALPAVGTVESILDKGVGSYRLLMDGSGLPHFADGMQPGGDVIGPNRIDDGQWHQLAGVFDGASLQTLYVDGQTAASVASATAAVAGTGDDLWIGGDPDTRAAPLFDGLIDEVAIFTNALAAGQIQQLYFSATNSPPVKFTAVNSINAATNAPALNFTFSTIVGRAYQLQFKTNLAQPTWSNLLGAITATNASTTISDPFSTNRQRFYRIILLPF